MAKTCAYAGNFICRHRCANTASTNKNAAFCVAVEQATRHGFRIIRIVHRSGAVSSHVLQLVPAFLKVIDEHLLQCEAGMVRTDGDLHDFFGNSSRAAANTLSGVNPNLFCNSLSGADAPNVRMPILFPAWPT